MSAAQQEYKDKIKSFQLSVMQKVKDKMNPNLYLKDLGFNDYL